MATTKTTTKAVKPATTTEETFFGNTVGLNHFWSEGKTLPLSRADKASIRSAFIRQGRYGKSLVFLMKEGNPRIMNWSINAPDYPVMTEISLDSIRISEVKDLDGNTIYRASGEAL